MEIKYFLSKEQKQRFRNDNIGEQFGDLIKHAKRWKYASLTFKRGRLQALKFYGEDGTYMPVIEKGRVKMIYVGKEYREFTVKEFLDRYGVLR